MRWRLHRAIQRQVPDIEALLLNTLPEIQVKVIDYLEDWLWYWDEPPSINKWMQRAYEILPTRFCQDWPRRHFNRRRSGFCNRLVCRGGNRVFSGSPQVLFWD